MRIGQGLNKADSGRKGEGVTKPVLVKDWSATEAERTNERVEIIIGYENLNGMWRR